MGRQIVKQPNGLYAVWSSVVDNFIFLNYTSDQIIEAYVNERKEVIAKEVGETIAMLEEGIVKPYFQFTKSWTQCICTIEDSRGEIEAQRILNMVHDGTKTKP